MVLEILVGGAVMPDKVEGQPALVVLGIGWKVSTRPHPSQDLSSGFPRSPGGRRLPAGADRGTHLEPGHWGDAAGRRVSYGALRSR